LTPGDAGAVDQAHQLAQRKGLGHHAWPSASLRHVALDEGAADLACASASPLSTCMSAIDDLAAFGGQHARRAFAQARGPAGDDEHLACDLHRFAS
jgi:hypothetical protein